MAPMKIRPWRPAVQRVRLRHNVVAWYVTVQDEQGWEIFGPTPYLDWNTALRAANRIARQVERRLR
jgi:hypothetical protein